MLATSLGTALLLAVVTAFILAWRWTEQRHPREPPYVRSNVPFIGHIIGMIRYGAKYFELVNAKTKHPIFALPMLNSRNYIIADPTLAGYAQRESKDLSFYLMIVEVTRRLIQFDAAAAKVTFTDIHLPGGGPGGLMAKVHEMMNRHLAPGQGLDNMTEIQMDHTSRKLNEMADCTKTNLYSWLRHMFSWTNMQAVYGEKNIFVTNPELEERFWQFEDGMLGLVIDVLPDLTARQANRARKDVLDGLAKYVQDRRYEHASPLIRERIETNLEHGMSDRMAGHSELIMMFAILGNAVPSLFWLTALIFSHPDLLRRLRSEVQSAVDVNDETLRKSGETRIIMSSKQIQKLCPLLYSSYRETLRYISLLTSPRYVTKDTILGGQYLLRQGSIVQIAGGVIHYDERIWGPDAACFNPYRFLSRTKQSIGGVMDAKETHSKRAGLPIPEGVPSPAYRAFGGGNVICPGRHFAQGELMATAAALVLGFDICGPGGHVLQAPEKDDTRIPLSVMKPVQDPQVEITRRQGWENVVWDITV